VGGDGGATAGTGEGSAGEGDGHVGEGEADVAPAGADGGEEDVDGVGWEESEDAGEELVGEGVDAAYLVLVTDIHGGNESVGRRKRGWCLEAASSGSIFGTVQCSAVWDDRFVGRSSVVVVSEGGREEGFSRPSQNKISRTPTLKL
jgi:hypothetical protein